MWSSIKSTVFKVYRTVFSYIFFLPFSHFSTMEELRWNFFLCYMRLFLHWKLRRLQFTIHKYWKYSEKWGLILTMCNATIGLSKFTYNIAVLSSTRNELQKVKLIIFYFLPFLGSMTKIISKWLKNASSHTLKFKLCEVMDMSLLCLNNFLVISTSIFRLSTIAFVWFEDSKEEIENYVIELNFSRIT